MSPMKRTGATAYQQHSLSTLVPATSGELHRRMSLPSITPALMSYRNVLPQRRRTAVTLYHLFGVHLKSRQQQPGPAWPNSLLWLPLPLLLQRHPASHLPLQRLLLPRRLLRPGRRVAGQAPAGGSSFLAFRLGQLLAACHSSRAACSSCALAAPPCLEPWCRAAARWVSTVSHLLSLARLFTHCAADLRICLALPAAAAAHGG